MSHDALIAELRTLRDQLPGVTDTVVATVDGLLVAADAAPELDPDPLAALAAATLGLARRTAATTGKGPLRYVVNECADGSVVVYALGEVALLAVLGDRGLNLGRLHLEAGPATERLLELLREPAS